MKDPSDGDDSRIIDHDLVPPVATFDLDPAHAYGGFSAQNLVVGRVRGRFEAARGTVSVAEDPSASTVEAHRGCFDHHAAPDARRRPVFGELPGRGTPSDHDLSQHGEKRADRRPGKNLSISPRRSESWQKTR
jgi:hypothetical protein